jgi:hypothetical protein
MGFVRVGLALVGFGLAAADCTLYPDGELSYCNSIVSDVLISDRNFPSSRLDSAARLTAQVICNQDWAAGAFVVGGDYGDGITDAEVCQNQGSTCQNLARSFACREAAGNKGILYYEALRDPSKLTEFEITSYERAPARIADPLWRAELGSDCPEAMNEPSPAECCNTLYQCNATTIRIGGVLATPSEFCNSVAWAGGNVVLCNPDGTSRFLADAAMAPQPALAALVVGIAVALRHTMA